MNEAQTINFELVSPEEKLISQAVDWAVVPGDEGDMGVGAGHAPIISSLRPGVVELISGGQSVQKVFIAGGFADISAVNCTVLAEEAIEVKNLDVEALSQELSNLKEDLTLAVEEADKARIERKLNVVEAKLQAAA